MRVVVRLEERVDPPAARALWRLLFSPPVDAQSPTKNPLQADNKSASGATDREAS